MPEGRDPAAWQNILSDIVHPLVWQTVRNQIVERTAIREKNEITLSLEDVQGLPNGQMVLCIDYKYELRSLRAESVHFEIHHYLDAHVQCAENNLPEFERVEIGSTNYSGSKLEEKIEDGMFSVTLELQPGYQGCVPVRTKRREVIYVPGSFNLVMNELCAGVRINLDKIPAGILAHVRGPHGSKPVPLQGHSKLNNFEEILLPGQGFEFRFTPTVATAATLRRVDVPSPLHEYYLAIVSPTSGANVQDGGFIKGTAHLPSDSFLWVFVGGAAAFGRWRPLGTGIDIKGDLTWEVPALYGRAADTGRFEILAVVVDQRTHSYLLMSHAQARIGGKSMDLPRPINERLVKTIVVEKPAIQIDRFNVERRGSVLADRRRSGGDRRSRQAG